MLNVITSIYVILIIGLTLFYIQEVNRQQKKINQELDLGRNKIKQLIDVFYDEMR